MKILMKSKTPNGIDIRIEDWSENYDLVGHIIAAFPVAKNGSKLIREGETFRLSILSVNDNSSYDVFNDLELGKRRLEDLEQYYSRGLKDKYYLGIATKEEVEKLVKESAQNCALYKLHVSSYETYGIDENRAKEIWDQFN